MKLLYVIAIYGRIPCNLGFHGGGGAIPPWNTSGTSNTSFRTWIPSDGIPAMEHVLLWSYSKNVNYVRDMELLYSMKFHHGISWNKRYRVHPSFSLSLLCWTAKPKLFIKNPGMDFFLPGARIIYDQRGSSWRVGMGLGKKKKTTELTALRVLHLSYADNMGPKRPTPFSVRVS